MRIRINPIRLMLVIAVIGLLVIAYQDAHGEEAKSYLKASNIDSRKTVVYATTDNGAATQDGYLKKSAIDSRRTVLYDKDGKQKGYFKKSYLDSRKTVYYSEED